MGWKRKTGSVTLVLSLLFTGLWIRSREQADLIRVATPNGNCVFISGAQRFVVLRNWHFLVEQQQTLSLGSIPHTKICPTYGTDKFSKAISWDSWNGPRVGIYDSPESEIESGHHDSLLDNCCAVDSCLHLAIVVQTKAAKSFLASSNRYHRR